MTLYHFINCVALTFVPPFIVYKTKLWGFRFGLVITRLCRKDDSSNLWHCFVAAIAFLLTKLGEVGPFFFFFSLLTLSMQMLLMATFVPDGEKFSIWQVLGLVFSAVHCSQETWKSFFGCADLVGLHYVLNRRDWLPVGVGTKISNANMD